MCHGRFIGLIKILSIITLIHTPENVLGKTMANKTASQYQTVEWHFENISVSQNPFDVNTKAIFTHEKGQTIQTGLFYNGDQKWTLRFTGTKAGKWSFTTTSDIPALNGHTGNVTVTSDPNAIGFVTHHNNRWARQRGDTTEAFLPQFVMYDIPEGIYQKPEKIDADLRTFIQEHGFTGLHTFVFCGWFDIHEERSTNLSDNPNPDLRTFEALEMLITKTHAAGGVVHIWVWGDESRYQTPIKWGINGDVDKRLQRYMATRLGPLPGWTMGYGYDLWEWVEGAQLSEWHTYMHQYLGWPHMLGARSRKNDLGQLSETLDYASYEQHRPDYDMYVKTIEQRPHMPAFSEDRFRIRQQSKYAEKDYTEALTRRGLWDATMAGGVANIWGNLTYAPNSVPENYRQSAPYPHAEWIATWRHFFDTRFTLDLVRDNDLTNGVCLRTPNHDKLIFYKANTETVTLDLSKSKEPLTAIAIDTQKTYQEIDLGNLPTTNQTWQAPYTSDWAIAVSKP